MNVPIQKKNLFGVDKKMCKRTTESSIGRKILAVLIFDVISVKRPLIIITINIIAACGTPLRNRSSSATVFDKPEVLFIEKRKKYSTKYCHYEQNTNGKC